MKRKQTMTEMNEFHLPTYKEIPAVGLYLDQTSKYINECLKDLDEIEITNSMIANYVKKHLIANPVKKQYGRDQIAKLIFIALTKSALSLDEMKSLFALQEEAGYSCEDSYTCFADLFEINYHDLKPGADKKEDDVSKLLGDIVENVVSNIRLHKLLKQTFNQKQ